MCHRVITHLYGTDIEQTIATTHPALQHGDQVWMGEYSKEYSKVNKRIENNPRENAKIEKLRQQWMNTRAPQALQQK
jgi:hypothetical protein